MEGMGCRDLCRRDFLATGMGGLTSIVLAGTAPSRLWADVLTHRAKAKACILLWMGGGPSQIDTWDPKPGKDTGGPTKAIPTSVTGIHIAEYLPQTAKQARHLAIIRSMTTSEGSHDRASYLVHTGYRPQVTVQHPSLGSIVWNEVGDAGFDLPHFVAVGGPSVDAGFLGPTYNPLRVQRPDQPPENLYPSRGLDRARHARRMKLLDRVENGFWKERASEAGKAYHEVHGKASRMMTSPLAKAFDVSQEKDGARRRYGRNNFGQGCLLARRLVEAGVKFVEVTLGGWDDHRDIFPRLKQRAASLDAGMSSLLQDLQDRRMLDQTLVIWMGEFGRTPSINQNSGRDHYPRAWSAVLAGGGVKGAQVIGATDPRGTTVKERPVKIADLFASAAHAFGIDPYRKRVAANGRPITVVDKEGTYIKELFS